MSNISKYLFFRRVQRFHVFQLFSTFSTFFDLFKLFDHSTFSTFSTVFEFFNSIEIFHHPQGHSDVAGEQKEEGETWYHFKEQQNEANLNVIQVVSSAIVVDYFFLPPQELEAPPVAVSRSRWRSFDQNDKWANNRHENKN